MSHEPERPEPGSGVSPTALPADLAEIIRRDIEALLFAAGEPLTADEILASLVVRENVTLQMVREALARLEREYAVDGPHGFEVARLAEGWCLRTNRLCEAVLASHFDSAEQLRLSNAAYETLAVVAYLQPVTRRQVAEIRGVSSDAALRTLVERELVAEVGRSEEPGQPVLYGTTKRFLVLFGLESCGQLPPLESFDLPQAEREELLRRLGVISAP